MMYRVTLIFITSREELLFLSEIEILISSTDTDSLIYSDTT